MLCYVTAFSCSGDAPSLHKSTIEMATSGWRKKVKRVWAQAGQTCDRPVLEAFYTLPSTGNGLYLRFSVLVESGPLAQSQRSYRSPPNYHGFKHFVFQPACVSYHYVGTQKYKFIRLDLQMEHFKVDGKLHACTRCSRLSSCASG